MNKTELGRTLEKKVNGWLKAAGWITKLVEPKKIFIPFKKEKGDHIDPGNKKKKKSLAGIWISKDQDIWGADILAIKKESVSLAIQVTADTSLTDRAEKFAKYPFTSAWNTLIFQAKKKSGRWLFYVYRTAGKSYYPADMEYVQNLFGDYFFEIENNLVYLEKMK